MTWPLWGLGALGLSLALTALCKPLARRIGAVAPPTPERWHREPIPLLGGVAIYLAVLLPLLFLPGKSFSIWVLLLAGSALFALGLIDDLRPLKPQTKLLGEILVASGLVAAGFLLRLTPNALLNMVLTLFWIVGITNALNLLDNMDGLATGIAAITVGFRLAFFLMDRDLAGAAVSAIFLGALLGFLVYNFPPASIFMGDAGSLFIGVLLSGVSLTGEFPYSRGLLAVLLFPVLILLVPIFDTVFVTITRTLSNRPISVGGLDHTSHRLVATGLSERQAVSLLYLVAFLAGSVAFLSYQYGLSYTVVLVALFAISLALLGIYLSRIRVYPEEAAALPQTQKLVRLAANFQYKRQLSMVVLDLILIILAYYSAYLLRFEEGFGQYERRFLESLPVLIACQISALAGFGLYRGIWRYVGVPDLLGILKAVGVGTLGAVVVLLFAFRFEGYSRAVFVLDGLLLVVFLSGTRLSFRVLAELLRPRSPGFRRVLLYGAGDGGELTLREIRNNQALRRLPVGFIDDDRGRQGTTILGCSVVGGVEQVEDLLGKLRVDEVVVTSTKIPQERVAALRKSCAAHGVQVVRASITLEP